MHSRHGKLAEPESTCLGSSGTRLRRSSELACIHASAEPSCKKEMKVASSHKDVPWMSSRLLVPSLHGNFCHVSWLVTLLNCVCQHANEQEGQFTVCTSAANPELIHASGAARRRLVFPLASHPRTTRSFRTNHGSRRPAWSSTSRL